MARRFELLLAEDLNRGVGTAEKRNPGGGTLTGNKIGVHSFAIGDAAFKTAWEPGTVAVGSSVSTSVLVPLAAPGDQILVSFSLNLQDLTLTANVESAGFVKAVLANNTGAPVTIGEGILRVLAFKVAEMDEISDSV